MVFAARGASASANFISLLRFFFAMELFGERFSTERNASCASLLRPSSPSALPSRLYAPMSSGKSRVMVWLTATASSHLFFMARATAFLALSFFIFSSSPRGFIFIASLV